MSRFRPYETVFEAEELAPLQRCLPRLALA